MVELGGHGAHMILEFVFLFTFVLSVHDTQKNIEYYTLHGPNLSKLHLWWY